MVELPYLQSVNIKEKRLSYGISRNEVMRSARIPGDYLLILERGEQIEDGEQWREQVDDCFFLPSSALSQENQH